MSDELIDDFVGEEFDADGNPIPKKGKALGFGDDDDDLLDDPSDDFFDLGLNLDGGDDDWS